MPRSALLCGVLLLAACSRVPSYQVYGTGYTAGAARGVPAGASVAVIENGGAANALLEHEVAEKVGRALAARGFRMTAVGSADVVVRIAYGEGSTLESREDLRITVGEDVAVKDSSGKVIGTASMPTTVRYEPSLVTTRRQWLTLTATEGRAHRAALAVRPLWIGEVSVSQARLPFREILDYLIVPATTGFGENHQQRRTVLRADGAALVAIRQAP